MKIGKHFVKDFLLHLFLKKMAKLLKIVNLSLPLVAIRNALPFQLCNLK